MISQNGLNFISSFEGFRTNVYQDSKGVWTIGFGSTYDLNGKPITAQTLPVTREVALKMLLAHLKGVESFMQKTVAILLNQNEYDAICSFIYNVGSGNFQKSTLLKKLNLSDRAGAANEFIKWNKSGGKIIAGLTRRRIAEKELFLS